MPMTEAEKIYEEIRRRIDDGVEMNAWDKLEEESDKQYEYFTYYLRLKPRNRSLTNAVNGYRRDNNLGEKASIPGPWSQARRHFQWDERAKAYDQYMRDDMREYVEHQQYFDLIQFRRRQRELSELITTAAFELTQRALEALSTLEADEIRPATIANYIKTATQVADFAHNLEAQQFALNKILDRLKANEDAEIEDLLSDIDLSSLDDIERELTKEIIDELIDEDEEDEDDE